MPDYNPALSAGYQLPQQNILPTLEGIAQLQIGQAHAGLYSLQALQTQRRYSGLAAGAEAIRNNQDPTPAMAEAMGDPGDIQTMQNVFAQRRAMMATPAGVAPDSQEKLNSIAASKYQAVVQSRGSDDDAFNSAVDAWGAANGKSGLEIQHLKSITNPQQRVQLARTQIATGVPTGEAVKPQAISPESNVTTTMDYNAGQGPAPMGGGAPNTPQSVEEQKKYGTALGEYLPNLQKDASTAKEMNFTLGQMEDESQKFTMGAYAKTATTFAKYLKPIANSFGNHSFDDWVGSNEDFGKNAGVLARQAVREISNRPSQLEFQTVSNQMPHDAMSQQGFKGITDQFRAINDFRQAKAFAGQKWQTAHGTMAGFEADWNTHIGPAAFLVANMSPEQRQGIVAGLSGSQKTSLVKQLQWAHDNQLEAGVF